jgi:hypothetical protein
MVCEMAANSNAQLFAGLTNVNRFTVIVVESIDAEFCVADPSAVLTFCVQSRGESGTDRSDVRGNTDSRHTEVLPHPLPEYSELIREV